MRLRRRPKRASCGKNHGLSPSTCPMASVWRVARRRCLATGRGRIWRRDAGLCCAWKGVRGHHVIWPKCPAPGWRSVPWWREAFPAGGPPADCFWPTAMSSLLVVTSEKLTRQLSVRRHRFHFPFRRWIPDRRSPDRLRRE